MKKYSVMMVVMFSLLFLVVTGQQCSSSVPGTIVGSWVSEGDNLSPIVKEKYNVTKIVATFNDDGSYKTDMTTTSGRSIAKGTYAVDLSTDPHGITLHTATLNGNPAYAADFAGIFQIDSSLTPENMTYEVVITNPPNADKDTPPTPEGGFGSTSDGKYGMDNVQVYVRE
jgi:hypothetical protein